MREPQMPLPLAGQHLHFNGLGGKGIAPATSLAHAAGMRVTGDDLVPNYRTRASAAEGIEVTLGTNTVPDTAALHVASAAWPSCPRTSPPSSHPTWPATGP
ncbi:Mur ligase domain-containing protein [Streptomyces sp. SS7]|uniref:Mur ligase domain-containing protein n=1 Tax=Streptomyces sp. SS7 TaxID=3108485 RepID=UPI0030EC9857